ncbi:ankyrin repeat domain-containing protein [Aliarcobacter cryaerophilus]
MVLGFFRADEDAFLKELMSSNINIDKLKKYIANGVNINGVDEKGRNYLFFFASKKNFNAMRVLISLGIDMYKEDKLGKTVLSEACEKYDFMMIKFLLDNGFDGNRKNSAGRTVLQDSVLLGNDKVFQILLNYNLDFDIKDNNGRTVVFDAIENGNLETLKKVIDNVKDINAVDKNGQTALFEAVLKDDLRLALTLINTGINLNILDKNGQNVLYNTILQGMKNEILLKHLAKRGINLNVVDSRDKTILDEIFYIMVLQKYDKDIDDKRYMLINPKDDYLSLALQIVELGFKVDTLDKYGKTALQKELERKNFTNAEFLLNCGASLNIFDEHHRSLFHIEVLKGYSNNKIIDFLIQKGANLNQRDKYFRTIIDNLIELILISKGEKPRNPSLDEYIQEDGGFDILLKKLLVYEADISYTRVDGKNIVFDLVPYDSFDILDILVEHKVDLNHRDFDGNTPLMYMVDEGLRIEDRTLKAYFIKRLQNFLKYRINMDIQDKDGRTVIHKAVIADDLLVVEKLMIKKANLDIKDNHGRTALHHTQWKGNYEIARWLILAGANMNEPDNSGFNILNYAAILGHTRLVITLISSGVLMYNNNPKNKKVAEFFKSKEKILDKLVAAEDISDSKMKNALIEVVTNFKKEINEALLKK